MKRMCGPKKTKTVTEAGGNCITRNLIYSEIALAWVLTSGSSENSYLWEAHIASVVSQERIQQDAGVKQSRPPMFRRNLAACLLLLPWFAYSSTQKMEAIYSSETYVAIRSTLRRPYIHTNICLCNDNPSPEAGNRATSWNVVYTKCITENDPA
jgi:hypothetical protein